MDTLLGNDVRVVSLLTGGKLVAPTRNGDNVNGKSIEGGTVRVSGKGPMNLDLEGRRVLITGGSKGIGLACARGFLAEGAHVAITSRSDANLSNARASLGQVMTVAADLADIASTGEFPGTGLRV